MMRLCAPCAFVSVAFFVCLAIGCNVINAWPLALIYTYTGNALKGTYSASTLREVGEGPRKIVKFWPNKRARLIPSTLKPNRV